jgi:hypothetical protein
MADYRLYFLDDQDQIRDVKALDCADDDEALQKAAEHAKNGRLELWRRSTLIGRFGRDGAEEHPDRGAS